MLRDEVSEMNPKIFLFVNPYDVNPGNSSPSATCQTSPRTDKTDTGERSNCEYLPAEIKLEMEEFSDLGRLIPSERDLSYTYTDEFDFSVADPEGIADLNARYDSPSLKEFVEDFPDCGSNQQQQLYIDNNNQHLVLDDISGDKYSILQQELSNSVATSALNELSNNNKNNNNKIIQAASLRDRNASNIFNFEEDNARQYSVNSDHMYANMSSPSEASTTPQYSPLGAEPELRRPSFGRGLSEFNLGVKLFVGDTLNTPDILESVVSLEDDRFNFLRNLDDDQQLKTINKNDLLLQQQPSSSSIKRKIEPEPLADTSWTPTPEDFEDDDDEDYVPPKKSRTVKKAAKQIESDSDEEYIPTKTLKKRTSRTSSVSSDSSKDSNRITKYRELRDKNNEASRKSRLKRKIKEQEMETEMQDLEGQNVKLKAKVAELKRMVDNFRSNLFKIMATK